MSSVKPRPQLALNFTSRVAATCIQGTLSGTRNGWRPHSANALSHNMVAHAWGSWFPWTITTTGKDGAHTYMIQCQYSNYRVLNKIMGNVRRKKIWCLSGYKEDNHVILLDNNFLLRFQQETLTRRGEQIFHPWRILCLSFQLFWSF